MIANWASGDVESSLAIFDVHSAIGAHLGMTYYRSLAAENAVDAGRPDTASAILEPALRQAAETGERYWEPQLLRLRARIAAAGGEADDVAVAHLERAVEMANAMVNMSRRRPWSICWSFAPNLGPGGSRSSSADQ